MIFEKHKQNIQTIYPFILLSRGIFHCLLIRIPTGSRLFPRDIDTQVIFMEYQNRIRTKMDCIQIHNKEERRNMYMQKRAMLI